VKNDQFEVLIGSAFEDAGEAFAQQSDVAAIGMMIETSPQKRDRRFRR
jgi:hypothetical protein